MGFVQRVLAVFALAAGLFVGMRLTVIYLCKPVEMGGGVVLLGELCGVRRCGREKGGEKSVIG